MIETERLKLIPATMIHFRYLFRNEEWLTELLEVTAAPGWAVFPEGLEGGYKMLEENPQNLRWALHFFVHRDEKKLIGMGGYKGAPRDGMVEIGYALSPDYCGQGLGTEAAQGLIDEAFSWAIVEMVDAHTLAEENASTKVLEKCGAQKIGEENDPEDGDIWHWRILRAEYEEKRQNSEVSRQESES